METQYDYLKNKLYKAIEKHKQLNNEEILTISRQVDLFIVQYYKDVQEKKEFDSVSKQDLSYR